MSASGHRSSREHLHPRWHRDAIDDLIPLAEHVKVVGADLANGMLSINLVHEVPEAMKPRPNSLGGTDNIKLFDREAA